MNYLLNIINMVKKVVDKVSTKRKSKTTKPKVVKEESKITTSKLKRKITRE